ncbi:MAG: hypothetical protein JWM80_4889 [Cyanobacteria bacterium RYN_339]|nr:hypothetical protein [Cyanobacteria bacterium RYN_339]
MESRPVRSISLVPLTPFGKGLTPELPLMAPEIVNMLQAISRADDLASLEMTAVVRFAPMAGAHTALIRPAGRNVRLSPELAVFEGRLEGLARRAINTGGFAWERQGDHYMAVFPLWAQGEPVGELMLAGAAGKVLQLVAASAPLLTMCGPLALALANLALRALAVPREATVRVAPTWQPSVTTKL